MSTETDTRVNEIGTVEVLATRVYNLDPENHADTATTVVVEPGTYALFSDGLSFFWLMRGRMNARGVRRMGDGMFVMEQNDRAIGPEVQFPSKTFGQDEWRDFVDGNSVCAEGHADQRLRIHVYGSAVPR